MAPDSREAKVLEHVEQLGLKRQGQLADLVQTDRPLVRVLELPELAPVRAREGPFSWPKSSDSISPDGIAAQLILTNGP